MGKDQPRDSMEAHRVKEMFLKNNSSKNLKHFLIPELKQSMNFVIPPIFESNFKHAKTNVKMGKLFLVLFPAVEGAENYLLNSKEAKSIERLHQIAKIQLKIDEKSLHKAEGYISWFGRDCYDSNWCCNRICCSWYNKLLIAGIAIDAIAIMYATYNCQFHWIDEVVGKQELDKVQGLINELLGIDQEKLELQSFEELKNKELQAIFNQRGDPWTIYSIVSEITV